MKTFCHILIMVRHAVTVIWIMLPPHILVSKVLTRDTVEIIDVDIDVIAVMLPAVPVPIVVVVVMVIVVIMMMIVMIIIPVDIAE